MIDNPASAPWRRYSFDADRKPVVHEWDGGQWVKLPQEAVDRLLQAVAEQAKVFT